MKQLFQWSKNLVGILNILLFSVLTNATEIEWYDTGVGDNRNTVIEVSCNNKIHKLVLKKSEVDNSEAYIIKWFDELNCKGDRNGHD